MEGARLRGITFRRRREWHKMTEADVAKLLRIRKINVIAFESGIIMQLPRGAEEKLASLNTKWTSEELKEV